MNTLPAPGFFWTLFAGLVVVTAGCWLVGRIFMGGFSWARLKNFHADEGASAVVEFPFALLFLGQIVLFTEQLFFLACGYLVVDYAAFMAARSASVIVPQHIAAGESGSGDGSGEGNASENANVVKLDAGKPTGEKGAEIQQAAWFCCFPISGNYGPNDWSGNLQSGAPDQLDGAASQVEDFMSTLSAGMFDVVDSLPGASLANRLGYAYYNTRVYVLERSGADWSTVSGDSKTVGGGALLTVRVEHDYQLKIPWGRWSFIDKEPGNFEVVTAGYRAVVVGQASMLCEGYAETPIRGVTEKHP